MRQAVTLLIQQLATLLRWRWLPAALLLAGVAERLVWALLAPDVPFSGEPMEVALTLLEKGEFADAYGEGSGPSAHVMPLMPLLVASVYGLLGLHTPASNAALTLFAITCAMASYGFVYRAFGLMGTPRPFRLAGLAVLCLAPLNIHLEVRDFRVWEGGLATMLASGGLLMLLVAQRQGASATWGTVARLAGLAALLFFINPPLGLGLYLCCLLVMIDRLPPRRWLGSASIAVAALALLIGPWAWRNSQALGEPVLLRSNLGLELALANHPAAVDPADPRAVFLDRLHTIHPFASEAARLELAVVGGELAYARARGREAWNWIASHPGAFARLCLRHAREYFLPPAWLWRIFTPSPAAEAKAFVHGVIGTLGLAGALVAGIAAWRRYRLAIIMLLAPSAIYMITQPVLRYRYIVFSLLVMFMADLLARAWRQRLAIRQAVPAA
jgi:hypothetical protein